MASFLRSSSPPRREWSVADAALFAARKEFELLKLLSTDKKALAVARRLGLLFGQKQMQPQTQPPAAHAGDAAAAQPAGAADDASAASPAAPQRVRRRSARRVQPAPQGHTLSRKRTHLQPLRAAMRLHFPIELLGGRWYKMEPLRVRTRGSAAAPRAARSVMRRGGGPYAQPQSLCFSSSSSGGALDSGVRRRA